MSEIYDVVIIGAGISGLQAARDIQQAGNGKYSYVVLEARDRVGGKTLTHHHHHHSSSSSTRQHQATISIQQDLGAAWINDTNQSRIWALAQELGLHCYEQNVVGDVVVEDFEGCGLVTFPYGGVPRYAAHEDSGACVRVRDEVEAISTLAPGSAAAAEIFDPTTTTTTTTADGSSKKRKWLDEISFETWLHLQKHTNERALATARVWTHAMLGVDPSEVSALYYLEYCRAGGGLMTMRSDAKGGGQYLRIKEGTSAFADGLHKMLKPESVRFGCAVVGIDDDHHPKTGLVTVTTKDSQQFQARKVIVSIPTPIYKTITFSPALSAAKSAVVNRTRYGFYCKYIVAFTKPFWRDRNFCGLAQSFIGPVSVFRDTSVADEATYYCLTSFIGGVFGRKWAAQTPAEKQHSVLRQISRVFAGGDNILDWFIEAFESPWMEEEWSGWGCPCPVMPPGVLADGGWEALCAPHGNVHFIGTELATVWRGYMEGAYRTAEKGAAEVIASLEETQNAH